VVRRGKTWLLGELVQSAVDGVCVLTHAVSSEEIIEQVWPVLSALLTRHRGSPSVLGAAMRPPTAPNNNTDVMA
jgi:hypothetical protein